VLLFGLLFTTGAATLTSCFEEDGPAFNSFESVKLTRRCKSDLTQDLNYKDTSEIILPHQRFWQ
jgi:hypothetical protein